MLHLIAMQLRHLVFRAVHSQWAPVYTTARLTLSVRLIHHYIKRIIKHALTFFLLYIYNTLHIIGLIRSNKTTRDRTSCIILTVIYGVMLINNLVNLTINWAILK